MTKPIHIKSATTRVEKLDALRWLSYAESDPARHAKDLLLLHDSGQFPLDVLLLAESEGQSVGATLSVLQNDGTMMVWLPQAESEEIRAMLLEEQVRQLLLARSIYGQCLITKDTPQDHQLLTQFGFQSVASLEFLRHKLTQIPQVETGSEFSFIAYDPHHDQQRLERLIEETYQQSADCPVLVGRRTGQHAVKSHQSVGDFHPDLWRIYQQDGRDVGVVLLSDHHAQNSRELVYMGVIPSARGQQLGLTMVHTALREAAKDNRAELLLGVDASNSYAAEIYNRLGFETFAQRTAYLWFAEPKQMVA
ncbi:GNAT family N-acetyltransferase [Calycomorphotria hydatis]|uniref:Mycothiol acetyltransferase n=1 Tax=Calycomorphotria hydatis TaxID=2528027 RepID=A0A517T5S7_9PLAN|nr:GNAT family N-acetyltransferase [Calycomorphotria hydatis]QDT63719.1 Mycothiol acetyltransferase [Calycomorphotria hydatis]